MMDGGFGEETLQNAIAALTQAEQDIIAYSNARQVEVGFTEKSKSLTKKLHKLQEESIPQAQDETDKAYATACASTRLSTLIDAGVAHGVAIADKELALQTTKNEIASMRSWSRNVRAALANMPPDA